MYTNSYVKDKPSRDTAKADSRVLILGGIFNDAITSPPFSHLPVNIFLFLGGSGM